MESHRTLTPGMAVQIRPGLIFNWNSRPVAQTGRARLLQRRCRWFDSIRVYCRVAAIEQERIDTSNRFWRANAHSRSNPQTAGLPSTAVSFLLSTLMPFAFEKLVVYQCAVDFADQVTSITAQFPRGHGYLADQLNRASASIATNIAEGNGRFTKADRRNFFGIARGSIQECVPLLELAARRSLITQERHAMLRSKLEEIAKMLSGLIAGMDKRRT